MNRFSILLPFTYVLRVSKKRLKQCLLNNYNTINIITIILLFCKMLIVNGLQRVLFEKIKFSILNSKTDKNCIPGLTQFSQLIRDTIKRIIVQGYRKHNHFELSKPFFNVLSFNDRTLNPFQKDTLAVRDTRLPFVNLRVSPGDILRNKFGKNRPRRLIETVIYPIT
jgi:hypothetical protein